MRRLFLPFFTILLLLCACAQQPENRTGILVNIRETDGFTVENNGQYVLPGDDAVFYPSSMKNEKKAVLLTFK